MVFDQLINLVSELKDDWFDIPSIILLLFILSSSFMLFYFSSFDSSKNSFVSTSPNYDFREASGLKEPRI